MIIAVPRLVAVQRRFMAEAVARFVAAGSNSFVSRPARLVAQASVVLLSALAPSVRTAVRSYAGASSVLLLTTVIAIVPPLLALGAILSTVEAITLEAGWTVFVAQKAFLRIPAFARFGDPTSAASDAILPAEL